MIPSVPSRRVRHPALITALGVILAMGVLGVGWFLWQTTAYYLDLKRGGPSLADRRLDASVSRRIANAHVTPADLAQLVPSGVTPTLGAIDAPITIVMFVDYQCPFCQRVAPVIRRVMADQGDAVRLVIRDFPITELHPGAITRAQAARCVLEQGQEVYWRYHDLLFVDVVPSDAAWLREQARLVGARTEAFDVCVSQGRHLTQVNADIEAGLRAGVQGTPTFFVNGIRFQGALDEPLLRKVIQAVMAQTAS
ncbi:MAG: hypothetical protein RL141_45 [Candidatus Parcubacteria bacterium]|jgi:protein-disulfide isomerase